MKERNGILVIQSLGLGDILFALPALRVLKKSYPKEKLTFLTHTEVSDILSLVPEVDEIISYSHKTMASLWELIGEVRRKNFRLVVILNPIFRGSVLARLSGAPVRVGYVRDYERKQSMFGLEKFLLTHAYYPREVKMHEVERYLDLLRIFGLPVENVPPTLTLPPHPAGGGKGGGKGKSEGRPIIAIHPGSAWELRQWPKERFAAVADWLIQNYGARVVFLGAEREKKLVEEISRQMKEKAESLAGRTSLSELASFLSGCDLFLTNDTGVMHIAAALDVPTVALFGPGDPVKVRPLSEEAAVLYHKMPCSPCRFQYTDRCQNNLCMKEITVGEVQETVAKVLGNAPSPSLLPIGESPSTGSGSRAESREVRVRGGHRPYGILFLQSTSEIGGTDITLLRMLKVLDRSRFEPFVVLPKEGPLTEEYKRIGCRVFFAPKMLKLTSRKGIPYLLKFALNYLRAVFQIAEIIRREKIDLVHTNTIHNLYGFLAAKITGRPHVWHIREIVVQSKLLRFLETRLVEIFSTRFIVMNNAIAKMFLRLPNEAVPSPSPLPAGERVKVRGMRVLCGGRGFPKNIVKLYDGLDTEMFSPRISGDRIRREIGIQNGAPLVGTVCRLDPWKGVEVFLEAARIVHSQMPEARFLVCGGEIEGHEGYKDRLWQKTTVMGLMEAVRFTDWQYSGKDIPEVYRALDVSVQCPIYPEPYGLANIEAMASSVPIVAANQGGPAEICVNGETALLVPPKDPRAAAEAVLKILRDRSQAKQMGEAGRRRVEALFDVRKCVMGLEAVYEEILQ